MASKVSDTPKTEQGVTEKRKPDAPAISFADQPHEAESDLITKPLVGVLYDVPSIAAKNKEHIFYLYAKNVPAAAGIVWMFTQPTGLVVWSGFLALYMMNILSMTLCYHRFFTHRSFETSTAMRYVLAVWALLGVYGSLGRWCAEHRRHHALSDKPGDIHSPFFDERGEPTSGRAGMRHAHLGWVFVDNITDPEVYGKGLTNDKAILFADKYRLPLFFVSVVVLPTLWALAFGGGMQTIIGTILIAGFLRCSLALHAIAALNSVSHQFGSRRFETSDRSHNNWLIAILNMGEGWHNNHHAHPRSANSGMAWYEIDMTGWVIWAMEKMGLIWNVRWSKYDNGKVSFAKRTKI